MPWTAHSMVVRGDASQSTTHARTWMYMWSHRSYTGCRGTVSRADRIFKSRVGATPPAQQLFNRCIYISYECFRMIGGSLAREKL